jgi:putative membrane protein
MTGRGMMGGMPMMGWGMHHGWGGGNNGLFLRSMRGGFLGFYIWRIIMWIVLLGVIGVIIWLVIRSQKQHGTYRQPEEDLPLEIAKRRYAKGEISREEFETIKRDLQ